jgi:hypothetical protein
VLAGALIELRELGLDVGVLATGGEQLVEDHVEAGVLPEHLFGA